MVAEMSMSEVVRWRAFYEFEPWGEKREDLRIGYAFARLASIMASLWVKNPPPVKVSDFIYDFDALTTPPVKPSYSQVREALFASVGQVAPPRVSRESTSQ